MSTEIMRLCVMYGPSAKDRHRTVYRKQLAEVAEIQQVSKIAPVGKLFHT